MRRLFWVLGLMLWAAAPARAATRDDAKRHFAAGEARYKAGDYRGAIAEFKAADAIMPSPILAYNEALCFDRLGDAQRALELYRDYLARRPDAPNRPEVEARIAALEPALPPPAPPSAQAPEPPPGATPPPPAAPEGDGLARPQPMPRQRRGYDESFARRLPPPAPQPQGQAEQAPMPAPTPEPSPMAGAQPYTGSQQPYAGSQQPYAGSQQPYPEPQPEPRPMAPVPPPQPEDKPVYKQWWFWVVVGVGAAMVVAVAADSGHSSHTSAKPAPAGLTLFNF